MGSSSILGIDPGLCRTGWGCITRTEQGEYRFEGAGMIKPSARLSLPLRLRCIYEGLRGIIQERPPSCIVIEQSFTTVHHHATLHLGFAKGVALLLAGIAGCSYEEIPATTLKKTLVGWGGATKEQVAAMVALHLTISIEDIPLDATDALGLALCGAWNLERASP